LPTGHLVLQNVHTYHQGITPEKKSQATKNNTIALIQKQEKGLKILPQKYITTIRYSIYLHVRLDFFTLNLVHKHDRSSQNTCMMLNQTAPNRFTLNQTMQSQNKACIPPIITHQQKREQSTININDTLFSFQSSSII
jgi:hypothetical protein